MRFSPKPGVTIFEILIGLVLIGLVAMLIYAVFSANLRLFLTQITGIGIAEQNKIIINDFTNQTRQAESVVTTCENGACPDDTTGDSTIVYRIWSLDAASNPTNSTYDYIVLRQDPLNTSNFIRKIYPDPASTRAGGTDIIATNLAANGLDFDYNSADPTQASQVTITVTTTSTESGKTQTTTNSAKAKLRNKPTLAQANLFIKTAGAANYDDATSIQQTSDGGYITAGTTYSFNDGYSWEEILVTKFNSNGNVSWAKTIGGSREENGGSIQQTSDGGYIIVGKSRSFPSGTFSDILAVKLDSSGNLAWAKTVSGASVDAPGYESVQQTSDGGYVIAAYTTSYGGSPASLLLVKLDSSGNLAWAKTASDLQSSTGLSVRQTSDGGYIVTGDYTFGAGGGVDLLLIKFDSSGNLTWKKTVGGNLNDRGTSVRQTSDSGYIVAGTTFSFGAGSGDILLVKFDSSGNVNWTKNVGGAGSDESYSLSQTSDGGYIVAGTTFSFGAGNDDFFLVKFDNSGDLMWAKTVGGAGRDEGHSVRQTSDGGYIVAGTTFSFGAGSGDILLVKTDSNGNIPGCASLASASPTVNSPSPTVAIPTNSITSQSPTVNSVSPAVTSVSLSSETQC